MKRQAPSRLRALRLERRWSQTQLSALTGIASPDLSALERGRKRPFPGWRKRLAAAFKVAERDLFPDEARRA